MKKGLLILFILSSFNSKGTIHQIGVWGGYYQFVPGSITIQLGDTIEWEPFFGLLPMMLHTITSNNIPLGAVSFDQEWQMPADTFFQYIPQVAGLYEYVCTPHIPNGMIGEFTVTNGSNTQTYVPDDNFEQALINLGYDNILDDFVNTANIDTVTFLDVWGQNIADLTGIEDFILLESLDCYFNQLTSLVVSNNTALTYLNCYATQLTNLDVSANTNLTYLNCSDNQLTNLDVSQNTALTDLRCYINQITSLDVSQNMVLTNLSVSDNQLTSLDVSGNTALTGLGCAENQLTSLDLSQNIALVGLICGQPLGSGGNLLTSLDVSNNTALTYLWCNNNLLTSLDVRNGNNTLLDTSFWCTGNPNLTCIDVDDPAWSTTNWTSIDPQHSFSTNCPPSVIQEHTTNKELLKVTDILGRQTKDAKNEPLFYIYDDGTVEKRITFE